MSSDPNPLVETAIEAFADEPPERRVALADEGAESLLADLEAESARGDRRHEAARTHVRLTLQEAALFGEPAVPLKEAASISTADLERLNAERASVIETGIDDLAAARERWRKVTANLD